MGKRLVGNYVCGDNDEIANNVLVINQIYLSKDVLNVRGICPYIKITVMFRAPLACADGLG